MFKLPASCQEVRDNPIYNEKNGLWFIQPTLDYEPFYVNCSFPTDVSLPAETILQPKMSGFGFTSLPNSSSGCHEPGCYQGKLYAVAFQITNHYSHVIWSVYAKTPYKSLMGRSVRRSFIVITHRIYSTRSVVH